MTPQLSEIDQRRILGLWNEYGDLLLKVANRMVDEAHATLIVRSSEYESLRQGIEIPARISAIKEFIKYFNKP